MGDVRYTQKLANLALGGCALASSLFLTNVSCWLAGAAGQTLPAIGIDLDDKIKQRLLARKQRGNTKYTPEVQFRANQLGLLTIITVS